MTDHHIFLVPGSERVERVYSLCEDRYIDDCETVLAAVTLPRPFPDHARPIVPFRRTKRGDFFGLFRVPKQSWAN